jgi:hypothetical protein
MKPWLRAVLAALTLGCGALGCGSSRVVHTALHGDLGSLQREVAQARAAGQLDRRTVLKLARAVAAREVRSASGDSATRRVEQVKPCARALVPVLRDRASRPDDAGAEASVRLLEVRELGPAPLIDQYAGARAGAWRAVAARAATLPGYAEFRRERFVDPDERVRRAAVEAELESPNRDNLEALLEVARLDPEALIRSRATEAVGVLGGQRAVSALKDHWARADEVTRTSIVRAWAEPASLAAGGRQELLDVAERPSGLASVLAAEELSRLGGIEGGRGRALLAHFIAHGTDDQKRQAVVGAPLGDPDVLRELRSAGGGRERSTAAIALARLTEVGSERADALGKLRQLASGNDHAALLARVALAAAGDRSVVERLRADLVSGRARARKLAAVSLYWLGDAPGAALGLADDDPSVRTEVACAILTPRISRR